MNGTANKRRKRARTDHFEAVGIDMDLEMPLNFDDGHDKLGHAPDTQETIPEEQPTDTEPITINVSATKPTKLEDILNEVPGIEVEDTYTYKFESNLGPNCEIKTSSMAQVPPAINQQLTKTLDKNTAAQVFKLLNKYRLESKQEKKAPVTAADETVAAGGKIDQGKKPVVVKYYINHITALIEAKKAQLSSSLMTLTPLRYDISMCAFLRIVLWLPALCRKMGAPYAIVKSKFRPGTVVHKKTATALPLVDVKPEDKHDLAADVSAVKANCNFPDTTKSSTRSGGAGECGIMSNNAFTKREPALKQLGPHVSSHFPVVGSEHSQSQRRSPKKPLSAYIFVGPDYRSSEPGLAEGEVTKAAGIIGQRWKELTDGEKKVPTQLRFVDSADADAIGQHQVDTGLLDAAKARRKRGAAASKANADSHDDKRTKFDPPKKEQLLGGPSATKGLVAWTDIVRKRFPNFISSKHTQLSQFAKNIIKERGLPDMRVMSASATHIATLTIPTQLADEFMEAVEQNYGSTLASNRGSMPAAPPSPSVDAGGSSGE
ncbi:60S ribosomal protein L8B [Rhizophlyctis rosea]|nr:60S ribosomal protein L8B [Rhizophlyctis rosea]